MTTQLNISILLTVVSLCKFINGVAVLEFFDKNRVESKNSTKVFAIDQYTQFQVESWQADGEWSYTESESYGPSNWYKISAGCGGTRQSPIDINLFGLQIGNISEPLQIDGANQIPESITVSNNGHSFVVKFNYANGYQARLRKGPLGRDTYYLIDSVHWHWGEFDFAGSEHRVNGLQFSAETHIVSYNSKYG